MVERIYEMTLVVPPSGGFNVAKFRLKTGLRTFFDTTFQKFSLMYVRKVFL
jgi:hypothetical protein